ncbi:MAG: histidine kinase N-terminal 7TM domain-containing protein [Anaerolineae bacterium]
MNWEYSPYLWPLIGSLLLAVFGASSVWPLRRAPGALTLLALLVAAAAWALTDLIQYGCQSLETKLVWENLVYIWAGLTPVLWLVFCLQYTYARGRLRVSEFASLMVIPAIGLLLAFANPTDGLMRRDVSLEIVDGVARIAKTYGPWFWVMAFYLQGVMLAGSVLLVRHISRSGRTFGAQGLVLLLAAIIPWFANVGYLVTGFTYFHIDPTPVAMGISGALLVLALRKMALFDLSPAGRDAAIEAMKDGWLVIDPADRIVDLNPAAQAILARNGVVTARSANLTGRRMSILSPVLSPMLRAQMDPAVRDQPVQVGRGATAHQYRVMQSQIVDRYGEPAGHVLTLHDVTREIATQLERDRLIQELQNALAEVNQLSGLLPICAECKKIRDDQGYWTQLEEYLRRHTDATFTHGLCPDCARRLEERATDYAIKNGKTAGAPGGGTQLEGSSAEQAEAPPSAAPEPGPCDQTPPAG